MGVMPPPPKGLGARHRIPVEKVKAVEQGFVRLVFAQLAHDHVPHLDGRTAGHDLVSQAHRIRDRGREGPSDALALAEGARTVVYRDGAARHVQPDRAPVWGTRSLLDGRNRRVLARLQRDVGSWIAYQVRDHHRTSPARRVALIAWHRVPREEARKPPPERRVIRVGGFHAQFADGHTGGDGQARVIGGRGEADRIFPDRLGTWVFDRAAEKDADAFIRRIVADDPARAHVFHADLARERQVDVFASGVGQRATGHVLRYVAALFDDMEAGGVELWVQPQVNPLHSRLPSRFRAHPSG